MKGKPLTARTSFRVRHHRASGRTDRPCHRLRCICRLQPSVERSNRVYIADIPDRDGRVIPACTRITLDTANGLRGRRLCSTIARVMKKKGASICIQARAALMTGLQRYFATNSQRRYSANDFSLTSAMRVVPQIESRRRGTAATLYPNNRFLRDCVRRRS